jgi:hypothetical protein
LNHEQVWSKRKESVCTVLKTILMSSKHNRLNLGSVCKFNS